MSARSATSEVTGVTWIAADRQNGDLAAKAPFQLLLQKLVRHLHNHVQGNGIVAGASTSGSTQATGAAGATVVRTNLASFKVNVNGQQKEFAAEADRVLHETTVYTGADAGAGTSTLTTTNCKAKITIVAKSSSATFGTGTISLVNCKGATHATAPVECTDAEIQAKVTGVLPWVKVAVVDIHRSADTSIAVTFDNTVQPALGINVDTTFFAALT